jgi:ubiquinone/menaquinone biosynthesis C-methylase UbiE
VNCCGALRIFPDVDRVLREIRRVLGENGRLTIAASRRGKGASPGREPISRRRLFGVDSFTLAGLMQRLEAAAFVGARCRHAAGL